MAARGTAVPPVVMDQLARTEQPSLAVLARALAEGERLQAFVAAPAAARVSDPLLPLFLAALLPRAEGRSSSSFPTTADARDTAEGASWFLGEEHVGLFASRGVRWGSGLEPPPHLVGERARALEVLEGGGLVCASAVGAAEGIPPADSRPETIRLRVGDEPGAEGLAERLALAGYERVEQAQERGQFAVRGGIVDVFPSTGREPVRDRALRRRDRVPPGLLAFHPAHPAHALRGSRLPGRGASRRPRWNRGSATRRPGERRRSRTTSSLPYRHPTSFGSEQRSSRLFGRSWAQRRDLAAAVELSELPAGQRYAFEAQRPAVAARGLAEAERDLAAFVRGGNRVVVTFAHRGEALRTKGMLRRIEPIVLEPGDPLPTEPALVFAVTPARRGVVLRDLDLVLLPDTQVFRKRPPRADVRLGRALQSFADLRTGDYVVHEDHGVGKLLGFETKTVAGVTRDYLFLAFRGDDRLYVPHEQIGKVSRYVGADGHVPALSRLGGKAWQTIKSRARAGARELAGELLALYAQRQRAAGVAFDVDDDLVEQLEASFPYEETPDQRQAIEVVKEDLESPRPMDRLVCGDVGFGKTEVAVRAAFAVAVNGRQTLLLAPTTILAQQHWNTFRERYRDLPVSVEMVSRFRRPADVKRILARLRRGQGRRPDRHAPRSSRATSFPKSLGLVARRRGAALRRRAEGAPAPAPPRGGRARAQRHADPAHAAHVARRASATSA